METFNFINNEIEITKLKSLVKMDRNETLSVVHYLLRKKETTQQQWDKIRQLYLEWQQKDEYELLNKDLLIPFKIFTNISGQNLTQVSVFLALLGVLK